LPLSEKLQTQDYLPGAFSGAVFGCGLARDLSHEQPPFAATS
jgi:hypothetical protein